MQIETTNLLIILGITLLVGLVTYLLIVNRKRAEYDNKKNQAILEEVRSTFEMQIYTLNDRLVQSEERWRDVNHLLLRDEYLARTSPITNSRETYYSDFLKSNGITEQDLIIDKRLVFILTPFHDYYTEDYKVIREECLKSGVNAYRGDENYISGDIFPEMLKLIVKANLIIANVNGRNPNVLYELGIAQALDKPVILISREPEKLPIDIKSKRFLIYRDYTELQEMIRKELQNIL